MCGLAGEIRFDGAAADVAARGADHCPAGPTAARTAAGLWSRGPVALGHRRLSIIDLSAAGSQPMVDSAARADASSFNGCIYNYRDLRAELEGAGYRFFSTSDTEVIGKAYAHWGMNFVDHFLGMFAFAIVEHASRPGDPRPRPAGHQAALPRRTPPSGCGSPRRLPALLAAGGTDT